jgi:hypothetical protein
VAPRFPRRCRPLRGGPASRDALAPVRHARFSNGRCRSLAPGGLRRSAIACGQQKAGHGNRLASPRLPPVPDLEDATTKGEPPAVPPDVRSLISSRKDPPEPRPIQSAPIGRLATNPGTGRAPSSVPSPAVTLARPPGTAARSTLVTRPGRPSHHFPEAPDPARSHRKTRFPKTTVTRENRQNRLAPPACSGQRNTPAAAEGIVLYSREIRSLSPQN